MLQKGIVEPKGVLRDTNITVILCLTETVSVLQDQILLKWLDNWPHGRYCDFSKKEHFSEHGRADIT